MNRIEIWQPKYSTNSVLVATRKIGVENIIVFTKAPTYNGEYFITGDEARKCKLTTNGKIPCFEIPMSKFTNIAENPVKERVSKKPSVKPLTLF